ncbi:MAG: hypothetical protein CMJ80_03135 [Planctomycetaceae bacterium]|nr:hypothetical protein [Planctomycetaceae bacterium]
MNRFATIPGVGQPMRLGLATRGNTHLSCKDVQRAIDHGINYLNWCGHADGMQEAIRNLGKSRQDVIIAVQLAARTETNAQSEIQEILRDLQTDYLDIVTYYYVEHPEEWQQIRSSDGAAEELSAAKTRGDIRAIGLTSHQRPLAAEIATAGEIDLVMIRYNAAHRGAEQQVFPMLRKHNLSAIAFTCLRWGALLEPTPDDPHDFQLPPAKEWYRYVLTNPAVNVALMAPNDSQELDQNLALIDDWRPTDSATHRQLSAHGDRVRQHARHFP